MAPPGQLDDVIALPDGFQPEGIAIGPGGTGYVGSLADGDVYVFDVRTGEEITTLEGPGHAVGRPEGRQPGRLFIAGGGTGIGARRRRRDWAQTLGATTSSTTRRRRS